MKSLLECIIEIKEQDFFSHQESMEFFNLPSQNCQKNSLWEVFFLNEAFVVYVVLGGAFGGDKKISV